MPDRLYCLRRSGRVARRVVGVRGPVGVLGADHFAGAQVKLAGRNGAQRDALGHRADQRAQVAADTCVFHHLKGKGARLELPCEFP